MDISSEPQLCLGGEPLEAQIWVPFPSVSNVFLGKLDKSAILSLLICTMGILIVSAS